MSTRGKFARVNSITFNKRFKEDVDCYEYLSLIKWENGFVCRKCNYEKFYKGKISFQSDAYGVNTMFEKVKFTILITFHIVFKISTKKK